MIQPDEHNKIRTGAENLKPNVEQIGNTQVDNMPDIVGAIAGDILTHGNLAFLQGLSRIAIFCFSNFTNVFLRKNLGSNSHSATFAFINVFGLQLLISFMQAANVTRPLTGASYYYGDFVLFVKLYGLAAIIQSGLIYYRLKFQPQKIVYSYSYGESLLWPYYQKVTKTVGLKHLNTHSQFQWYLEPVIVFGVGWGLTFMGYSLGTFIMICSVASFLQASEMRKNLRKEIEKLRDATIISNVLFEAVKHSEKDEHEIRKHGFAIGKTEINSIKHAHAKKPVDNKLKSLMDEQELG
jgi:hypothetical protein